MSKIPIDQSINLALQHHQAGRLAEAQSICRQILSQQPNHAVALYLLGAIADQTGQKEIAIDFLQQAIRDPSVPHFYYVLGTILSEGNRQTAAIAAYRNAVQLKPDFLEAQTNLSYSLRQNGQLDQAIAAARKAIELDPRALFAHINLGTALLDTRRLAEAVVEFRTAIDINHHMAVAHNNLGNALKDQGQLDEAIASLKRAVELSPNAPRIHSNFLNTLHYHPDYGSQRIFHETQRWNTQHAAQFARNIPPHQNDLSLNRKLKIGYVSRDFRHHSVARFLLPLLLHHDHTQFEIHCFSDVIAADATTAHFRQTADRWHDVSPLDDEQLTQKIREEKIDILIDLAGHTAGNRLMVFARKPAPIQVTWLGYPATTGLSTIDYRFTDAIADPPGLTDSFNTEKLIRLPQSNWCYQPPPDFTLPDQSPRDESAPIIFGSFNNIAKINPTLLKLWAKILSRLPNFKLLLKGAGLSSPEIQNRIQQTFQSQNIASDRLAFRGSSPSTFEHLATYNQMDIALDTFPYNGATTTCEALSMGVPVITLAGQSHVSRVGTSMLTAIGLPNLIANTSDQYIQLATALAQDRPRLKELHATLRDRLQTSPLMAAPAFAHDIESAYSKAWRTYCTQSPGCTSGDPPSD